MLSEPRVKRHALEAATAVKMSIDTNPLKRKSTPIRSNDVPIGRNNLQAAFKAITGMTLRRYRLKKRMELARDLLATGELTVKQVSIQCGYKNPSNFTGDFKKIFELAPADWMRAYFDRYVHEKR